jgi:hypothetical protein
MVWHMVKLLLQRWHMEERRGFPERRHPNLTGRRATDQELERPDVYCFETRGEVVRLRAVIEVLADAVQALTASHAKPSRP